MADVILVQPKSDELDFFRKNFFLPLGLLNSCVFLNNYKIKFIDTRVNNNWKRELLKELKLNPLCVAITSMTGTQIKYALEISKFVKENSDTLVVWGGIHASLLPEQTLKNQYIDIIVKGEGEITFKELVEAIERKKTLKGIKSIWYKKKGKIKKNQDRPFLDLNQIPDFPYHLIKIKDYIRLTKFGKTLDLETSRGCPNKCTFCYNFAFNKLHWRPLTSDNVIKKIQYITDNFKIDHIEIIDDNFFVNLKRSFEIIKRIKKEKYSFTWSILGVCIKDLNRVSNTYLKCLEDINCKCLSTGIGSGSNRILKLIKKDITVNQILKFNKKIKKFDIYIEYASIAGFPSETKEELKKTIQLLFQLKNDNPRTVLGPITCFIPFPGTELFDLVVKLGFKMPSTLQKWSKFHWRVNYSKLDIINWQSPKHKLMIENLNFSSVFLDPITILDNFAKSKTILFLSKLFKHLAEYRVKNLYFDYMFEKNLYNLFRIFYNLL